ncbi:MAG: dienelactone hydrolase [Rhodocyclaceae bacterium]|nr:dienelactone hydrolase [Rhodocyclaceae bacterium]
MSPAHSSRLVRVAADAVAIEGMLESPGDPLGVVLFAHGSGSGRLSPRNNYVAQELRQAGLATLLIDLLTPAEDRDYSRRFDIDLLTSRLADAARFLSLDPATATLPVGLFGASTGAAAALRLAATEPSRVQAVVSRGGRPDLAGEAALSRVCTPTLLIVGGLDYGVIELNEAAFRRLGCIKQLAIVPGATHLFEEPGTLEEVAIQASAWFRQHLSAARRPGAA